ncbi:MAG TPA: ActS/PrrB/RegB family redox-sensitive histidine kinase [Rhizomicrobium sp.]|nr:ActS/PrrB/RegB family redox-sensitive histidine kinase [Rhizomicrobium sp.]
MNETVSAALNEAKPRGRSRSWPATGISQAVAAASRGRVRLRTLTNLRWLAVAGQSATLFIVYFGLGYPLPVLRCAIAVLASVALNLILTFAYGTSRRLTSTEATLYLGYDVLQMAALLYLTGGIQNPFALMFLAPVVIGAATLDLANTLILAAIAFVSVSVIAIVHEPLPWSGHEPIQIPALYQGGFWISIVIGIGFTSIYAWRIASEGARMSAGLAATQLALAREHRLAALGALATAAAHELGTPLGTIAVVSRELERALPPASPEADDARLLREQAERCRAILSQLARPEESVLGATNRLPLGALLDDIASPYRGDDVSIRIECANDKEKPQPKVWRAPELVHGLGNIIGNAADFAGAHVTVRVRWDDKTIRVSVEDDGPGFSPEILERLGEPYITSRPGLYALGDNELAPKSGLDRQQGMGLGFFIAKTLIEQTGGAVSAVNLEPSGARVTSVWPRGAIDGDTRPSSAWEV